MIEFHLGRPESTNRLNDRPTRSALRDETLHERSSATIGLRPSGKSASLERGDRAEKYASTRVPASASARTIRITQVQRAARRIGPGAAMVQDLVPARLRGTASAAYLVVITFIGLALGPYTIGRLSVALGNDLRQAMLWGLLVNPVAALLLWRASVHHRGAQRITEDF